MNNEKQPKNFKKAGILLTAAMAISACSTGEAPKTSASATAENTPSGLVALPSTEAPSGSASPEASSTLEVATIETFHLVAGDKFEAKTGDVVIGDIAMSDTGDATSAVFLFDTDTNKADGKDNTKTGMLVDVQKDGFVLAPYGGDVIRGLTGERKTTWIDLKKAEMENGGCVGGCTDGVDVVTWTGAESTVTQSGIKSEVSVKPSAEPTDSTVMTTDQQKQELLSILSGEGFKNLPADEQQKILEALIKCICSGPAVTPEPTPSPKPEQPVCEPKDHLMKPGEKFKLKGPFIVQGDVSINGIKHYDNSEKTGAIDVITSKKIYTIVSPWGADVQSCLTREQLLNLYKKDKSELKATGRSLDKKSVNQLN